MFLKSSKFFFLSLIFFFSNLLYSQVSCDPQLNSEIKLHHGLFDIHQKHNIIETQLGSNNRILNPILTSDFNSDNHHVSISNHYNGYPADWILDGETDYINSYGIQYDENNNEFWIYLGRITPSQIPSNSLKFLIGNIEVVPQIEIINSLNGYNGSYRAKINYNLPIGFTDDVKFIYEFSDPCNQFGGTVTHEFILSFNNTLNIELLKSPCPLVNTSTYDLDLNILSGVPPFTINLGSVVASPPSTPQNKYNVSMNGNTISVDVPSYFQSGQTNDFSLTISVIVTDALGNSASDQVTIASTRGILSANPSIINQSCSGKNNGGIILNAYGGAQPRSILWDNGAVSANRFGLFEGTYNAIITDANGCESSHDLTVYNDLVLGISANVTPATLSGGGQNGTIDVSVTNGTAPYTYFFNNSPIPVANPMVNKPSGTYSVKVKDVNGCFISTSVIIDYNPNGMLVFGSNDFSTNDNIISRELSPIDNNETSTLVYPNPSPTGVFNVEAKEFYNSLTLLDGLGRVLYTSDEYNKSLNLLLENSPSGIYFLKIYRENSMIEEIKLFKQ